MCVNVDIDIEFEVEKFAESLNHFINGETFVRESGSFRRSGEYLPLLETFGTKYVRALEPLIREKTRLPENKGISRVVDRLNLNQNLLFEEFISPYLSCEPDPDFEYAKTEFLRAKRNVTKLFNRIFHFAFDERKVICENLETTINAISACVVDSRYNRFGYDFMGLFRYYYQKEINNKESNNESKEISSEETNENEKQNGNKVETEPKEVSSEETNNNNEKDQENEIIDIESTIEHFAETFNHFINGETFIRDSGTCKRSGRYLPLLEAFGSKYVRALETLIRERMRLPENKGISRVVDRLNLDQNLLFEKLNSHYLRYTPGASLKCAETRFLEAKRNVTKLFNRLCYFSFDIYVERSEVIEKIRENLETIINAIAACVEDSRYNKFGYDFMDLFRYYYKKEINKKENNNESKEVPSGRTNNKNEKNQENEINEDEPKEVSSEETNNNNDKDQENETNENENNNTKKDPWFFIIRNAKVTEVEV